MAKKQNKKQTIDCNVNSCKYNDCDVEKCTLNEIKVSCDCTHAEEKKDTICDSYSCKDED